MRSLLAMLAVLVSLPTSATNTWGTDASDLWFNPNESGWGLNVAHQQEVLFVTLFVYSSNGQARWFVGPDLRSSNNSYVFTGPFYETNGPFFGGFFNPNAVGARQVGSATFTLDSVETATFRYAIDGTNVTKSIQRQTFRTANLSGTYSGAVIGTLSGCGSGTFASVGDIVVNQQGSAISISGRSANGTLCNYAGTYSQFGRMGFIQATLSCAGGATGSLQVFEIEAGYNGFLSRYIATYGTCREEGRIGGMFLR